MFDYPGRIPRGASNIDNALGARHHDTTPFLKPSPQGMVFYRSYAFLNYPEKEEKAQQLNDCHAAERCPSQRTLRAVPPGDRGRDQARLPCETDHIECPSFCPPAPMSERARIAASPFTLMDAYSSFWSSDWASSPARVCQESNAQACPPAVLGWSAAINTSVGRHTLSDVVENLRRLPAPTLP